MKKETTSKNVFLCCVIFLAMSFIGISGVHEVALADGGGWEPPIEEDTIPDNNSNGSNDSLFVLESSNPISNDTFLGNVILFYLSVI